MSQWQSYSYWGALLTDCWILCGIGVLFGIRFTRLFPALLAMAGFCHALTLAPQIADAISRRKLPLRELESELRDSPARFLSFCAMTLVLSVFGFARSCQAELPFEFEEGGADEGELDLRRHHAAPDES